MPAEPEGAQDAREERRSACQRVMQRREDSRRGISGRLVTDNRQHLVFVSVSIGNFVLVKQVHWTADETLVGHILSIKSNPFFLGRLVADPSEP
jgi:RNase P/RNase MRP subunit p29